VNYFKYFLGIFPEGLKKNETHLSPECRWRLPLS